MSLPSGPTGGGQTNSTGDTIVTPTSQIYTETVTLTGTASVRNIIVGTTGLDGGARINILIIFSCDDGVTVNVKNSNNTGLFSFVKNGGEANAMFKIESTGNGGLRAIEQTIPAFPVI